jgi:hypothetical protein
MRYGSPRFYSRQLIAILLLFLGTLYLFLQPHVPSAAFESSFSSLHGAKPDNACAAYQRDASIVIVVKTGASEIFTKVPTQLLTFLSCAPNDLLIFSDHSSSIGVHRVHDSLSSVSHSITSNNSDFTLYNAQQASQARGEIVSEIQLRDGLKKAEEGWKLDKYKNIHTAQQAWDLKPKRDWYFFIDADTYIVWANFFLWLRRMDPKEPLYIGSKVNIGTPPFAHGGSGYLLSRTAMMRLVGRDRVELAERYDLNTTVGCCGDQELGRTLVEKGIVVQNVRPVINGEKLRTMPFARKEWRCSPIATMHHMGSEEVNELWRFEQTRVPATVSPLIPSCSQLSSLLSRIIPSLRSRPPIPFHYLGNPNLNLTHTPPLQSPLLLNSLYNSLLAPHILPYRKDWDNLSYDTQSPPAPPSSASAPDATLSFSSCRSACATRPSCLQFLHFGRTCKLESSFKFGVPHGDRTWEDFSRSDEERRAKAKKEGEARWVDRLFVAEKITGDDGGGKEDGQPGNSNDNSDGDFVANVREDGKEEVVYRSGWMMERIEKWVAQDRPCGELNWVPDEN